MDAVTIRDQTASMGAFIRMLCVTAAVFSADGCSVLSPDKGSLKELEATRRSIENPSGFEDDNTRLEGTTAEKDAVGKKFLETIGLVKKRRRDIEQARSEFKLGEDAFEAAKNLKDQDRVESFRHAAKKYKSAAKNWQSSALEQDALLMAAESYFFAEDYTKAENMYAQLIKEYPRNPYLDHVDTRRFEIADYWLKYDSASHQNFLFPNLTEKRLPLNDTAGHGRRVLAKSAMMPRCGWR
jgi:tetratricopeptide (TPR) repeat protein